MRLRISHLLKAGKCPKPAPQIGSQMGSFGIIFRHFPGLGWGLGGSWGMVGGRGGVLEGLRTVLGPSWAGFEGSGGRAWGSFSALRGVLFGSRFRGPFGRSLGIEVSYIFSPKSAPQRHRAGHRNQLGSVVAKVLIFDNPPTFLADFCWFSELQSAPEWSGKSLLKRCPEEDDDKT